MCVDCWVSAENKLPVWELWKDEVCPSTSTARPWGARVLAWPPDLVQGASRPR